MTLPRLFLIFLRIGATAFGGGGTMLAMTREALVEKTKALTDQEVLDGIAVGQMLPGPQAANSIAFFGHRLRGAAGALVAQLGLVLPSFVMMVVLAWLYLRYGALPGTQAFLGGVRPAVVGLLVAMTYRIGKPAMRQWKDWLTMAGAGAAALFWPRLNVVAILLLAGAFGFVLQKRVSSDPQTGSLRRRGKGE